MIQLVDSGAVRQWCEARRAEGQRIGFVPTMGALHAGHLSLMRIAAQHADALVVSIFVNPLQFGPSEDLVRYPRDLPGDGAKCAEAGVALLYCPTAEQLYPPGFQTRVEVASLARGLCGERRPGHFSGVCTVVAKLLNVVGPCVAVFGAKDYQQLQVIRRMVVDLDQPVQIVSGPIVREADGGRDEQPQRPPHGGRAPAGALSLRRATAGAGPSSPPASAIRRGCWPRPARPSSARRWRAWTTSSCGTRRRWRRSPSCCRGARCWRWPSTSARPG
jgi:cytidyltransferase-like protein